MGVSDQEKQIAKYVAKIFGEKASVFSYADDNEKSKIAILDDQDSPNPGEVSYSTVGLSNYDIHWIVEDKPLRVEIVGACTGEFENFGSIISTCAFNIINSGCSCSLGAIYPDVVAMYYPDLEMKHIMFVSPFLWDDKLETLHFDDMEVAWLQAIPISEAEYAFAEKNGTDALEDLLERAEIDILDLERKSVI